MLEVSWDDYVGIVCDEVVSTSVFDKSIVGVEVMWQVDIPLTSGLIIISEVSEWSFFGHITLGDPSNAAVKARGIQTTDM
tara:strand:+ start:7477 stop:7716 length:240 start_codon:yes stop_codon:yes gene_type:complete